MLDGAIVGLFLGLVGGAIYLIRWAAKKALKSAAPKLQRIREEAIPRAKKVAKEGGL